MMILTNEERERFRQYLEEMAHSNDQIVEQLKLLNMPVAIIQANSVESAAARIIAKRLGSTESDTIGPPLEI